MTDADWAELAGKDGGGKAEKKTGHPMKPATAALLGVPVAAAVGPPPGFESVSRPSTCPHSVHIIVIPGKLKTRSDIQLHAPCLMVSRPSTCPHPVHELIILILNLAH